MVRFKLPSVSCLRPCQSSTSLTYLSSLPTLNIYLYQIPSSTSNRIQPPSAAPELHDSPTPTTTAPPSTSNRSFLTLPPELRLIIYDHTLADILDQTGSYHVPMAERNEPCPYEGAESQIFRAARSGILWTCKLICREAAPVFAQACLHTEPNVHSRGRRLVQVDEEMYWFYWVCRDEVEGERG